MTFFSQMRQKSKITILFLALFTCSVSGMVEEAQQAPAEQMSSGEKADETKTTPLNPDVPQWTRTKKTAAQLLGRSTLLNGWYLWDPYQYIETVAGLSSLTGMDVKLVKLYASTVGLPLDLPERQWKLHLEDLKEGTRDMATGAAVSEERKKFGYYSIPFRNEEDVIFLLKKRSREFSFNTPLELINLIRTKNLKLAVCDGTYYASKELMDFINDPKNNNFVIRSKNDPENLDLVLRGNADFYMVERMVGATIAWRMKTLDQLDERRLKMTYNLHLLFSKKTVPYELVERFNDAIMLAKSNGEQSKIISSYLFPVLLMQTLDSQWFFIMELIGIVAFAISGLVIAFEERANFFGTLAMTALPSMGGGIMRDLVANRTPISVMKSPSYVFIVIGVVLCAFLFVNLRKLFFPEWTFKVSKEKIKKMGYNTIQVCDAIGLGAFTVVGVTVALIVKADPFIFWGPVLAAITGVGGGYVRDMLRQYEKRNCLNGELYVEIALIWGGIFALIMEAQTDTLDADHIIAAVLIVATGAALTRILAHIYKIPGIPFQFNFERKSRNRGGS